MTDIHEFKKQFDKCYSEIGHHKVSNEIKFFTRNKEGEDEWLVIDDSEYIAGIENDTLVGCGCVKGLVINLKKKGF